MATDVGSLIMRIKFSPAMDPASFIACRCKLLKYAGTLITASFTVVPTGKISLFASVNKISSLDI